MTSTLVVPDKKGSKTPLGSLQDEIKHNYLVILTFFVGICGASLAFVPLEIQYDAKTDYRLHSILNTWLLVGIVVAALRLFDLGSYSAIFGYKLRVDFTEKISYFIFFSINLICLLVIMKLLSIYGSKYVDIVRCVVSCCQIVSIVSSLLRKNFVYMQSSLRPYLGISNLITTLMFSIGDIMYVLSVLYSRKQAFIVTAVFFATCIMIQSMLFIASFCELLTEYQQFIVVLRMKAGHLIYGFTTLCFFIIKLVLMSESWSNSFSVGNDIYRNVILSVVYLIILSCIPNGEIYSSYAHTSEELASKNTFVRYISHEIRSPLSTVNLGIELLVQDIRKFSKNIRKRSKGCKSSLRSSESHNSLNQNSSSESINFDDKDCNKCQDVIKQFDSISDILKDIQLSCEIATSTLNDLLSFDKIQSKMMHLEKRLMNAWHFVNESIRPYYVQAAAANVQLVCNSAVNFSIDHFGILVDQFKLVQVIRNFLSNALKFSQRNSTVIVNLRRLDTFSTTCTSNKRALHPGSKGVLRFEVIDHGVGVSKENQSKLFSQYVQLNAAKLQGGNGSGLGLWLSKAIVELHGGVIGMESDGEGLGCCFFFEVPGFEYNHLTGRSASTINVSKQISFDLGYATRIVLGDHSDSANSVKSDEVRRTGKVRFKMDSEESSTSIRGLSMENNNNNNNSNNNSNNNTMSPQQVMHNESRYVRVTSCDPMNNNNNNSNNNYYNNSMCNSNNSSKSDIASNIQQQSLGYNNTNSNNDNNNTNNNNDNNNNSTIITNNNTSNVVHRNATILIVDDTPLSRKMVERALSSIADKILHAVDGEKAIQIVAEQIHDIDIILIDYYMPKMNGPDAVRSIRQLGFKGIVLGVTGSVADEDTRSFLHSGADKVLAKPLTLSSFQEALEDLEVTRIDIQ